MSHLISVTLLALCLVAGGSAAAAQSSQTPAQAPSAAEPPAPSNTAAEVTSGSQAALLTLDDLTARAEAFGTLEAEADAVDALRQAVERLLPEGRSIEDLAHQPALLDGVLARSRSLGSQSKALVDDLAGTAARMEATLGEVRDLSTRWQAVKAQDSQLPEALEQRIDRILTQAGALESQLTEGLNRAVSLQNVAMEARNVINPLQARISMVSITGGGELFEQNAAPVWRLTTEHITRSSQRATRSFAGALREDFVGWLTTSEPAIGGHLLLLPLLLLVLFRLRKAASEAPAAALARPAPTAILIWMLIGVAIYAGAPVVVRALYLVAAMAVAGVVLFGYVPRNMRAGVAAFLLLAMSERIFSSLPVADHLPRLAYLVLGLTMIVIALLGRRPGTADAMVAWGIPRGLLSTSIWLAVVVLAAGVAANGLGYVHLCKILVSGVLISVAVFLVLFAGLTSILEILSAVAELPALDNFRALAINRQRIKRVLRRPLVLGSLILWVLATARAFGIDGWLMQSFGSLLDAELAVGKVSLSLGGVLLFVIAVLAAVWVSRTVRAVVDHDILYRMQLPRGVPNTISMTLHYAIILIGLLLGVGFMGVDLGSLAFIVGALGVGIGFGLQNVVNNFVSGLILIFEAPIQVGDTVEVGELMGKVVQIGIRTSKIRTFSGSDVIVPNGELVSNRVINWTLSDRKRRLELAVGVAYGSNPEQVTAVLRTVVDADPDVLDDPAPIILFDSFGDSALSFRVLAWIADFDQSFVMRHRLNVEIEAALRKAGIEIPFPQRDLHVRSLPAGLAPPIAGAGSARGAGSAADAAEGAPFPQSGA